MKNVLNFFLTWYCFWVFTVSIAYLAQGCEIPFCKCFQYEATWIMSIIFGWVPAVYVVLPDEQKKNF